MQEQLLLLVPTPGNNAQSRALPGSNQNSSVVANGATFNSQPAEAEPLMSTITL